MGLFKKKDKTETKEYKEQTAELKNGGKVYEINVSQEKDKQEQKQPQLIEQVAQMTDLEYRTAVLELLMVIEQRTL